MPSHTVAKRFPDENKWPFLGRTRELNQCLAFLQPDETSAPSRLLHIAGESGTGKSFFVKELICCFAKQAPASVALYINVEESEFESTQLEKRLALLASYPAEPTRKDPQHIPTDTQMAKYRRPAPLWLRGLKYTYSGIKEAATQIPFVGKVISAFLPRELPVSKRRELAAAGRFWDYLILTAQRVPVLLVIDNFQFLPDSVAMEIDSLLAGSETGFRLVIVERLREGISDAWELRGFGGYRHSLELTTLTYNETLNLVRSILGKNVPNLPELSDVIFRKSQGNPKQIWLQLRSYQLSLNNRIPNTSESLTVLPKLIKQQPGKQPAKKVLGSYEETIVNLPTLDRIALQMVTLVMGGIKVEDLVSILRWMVHPISEDDIKRTIRDLALVGLLIINGTQNNRVRTEHELVSLSVRRITTEEETYDLRQNVVSALSRHLEHALDDEEYERLVDRLIGLLSPQELRKRHDLLAHLISLIDKQYLKERFHYLTWLFGTPSCSEIINLLPRHCLEAFLDAFQKTSQFDKGLAAIELIRIHQKLPERKLTLFAAKYLVQKFEYDNAETLLRQIEPDSDSNVILFNIMLNLCRDKEARQIVESLTRNTHKLDEFQCVMLRNCSHLYKESIARQRLGQAKNGFVRLGLTFGEATALNNLGVLELWSGNYDTARKLLTEACSILERLDSNEVYQPLTNLAVLHALEKDLDSAKQLLNKAKIIVSPGLKMDAIMLQFNQLMIELLEGNVTGINASVKASELYNRSLKTMDKRFQDVLSWFANQMESLFTGGSSIPIPQAFDSKIRNSKYSGLEIFSDANIDGRKVTIVFILSPHWRY